jgi:hypothetical protein
VACSSTCDANLSAQIRVVRHQQCGALGTRRGLPSTQPSWFNGFEIPGAMNTDSIGAGAQQPQVVDLRHWLWVGGKIQPRSAGSKGMHEIA